jgi:phosphate transport system ATP-binding protein
MRPFKKRLAGALSGGMKQKLQLVCALIHTPRVLLLDEPTASLDAKAAGVIEDLISNLKSSCTILMVSHYLDQVRRVADEVMELTNGCLAHCSHM